MRQAVAMVAGYLVFGFSAAALFAITGHDPHVPASMTFMVLTIVYGMFFAALGGFVAVAIARQPSPAAAAMVAALIAFGAGLSLIAQPGAGAVWSQLAALILMAPSALAGGIIRLRTRSS